MRFRRPAEVYLCDCCGRDITHLMTRSDRRARRKDLRTRNAHYVCWITHWGGFHGPDCNIPTDWWASLAGFPERERGEQEAGRG